MPSHCIEIQIYGLKITSFSLATIFVLYQGTGTLRSNCESSPIRPRFGGQWPLNINSHQKKFQANRSNDLDSVAVKIKVAEKIALLKKSDFGFLKINDTYEFELQRNYKRQE